MRERVSSVAALIALASLTLAATQLSRTPPGAGVIGFYTSELLGRLENENRLNDLCPLSITTVEARDQCRGEMLTRPYGAECLRAEK